MRYTMRKQPSWNALRFELENLLNRKKVLDTTTALIPDSTKFSLELRNVNSAIKIIGDKIKYLNHK
jgi:hypothetical protein